MLLSASGADLPAACGLEIGCRSTIEVSISYREAQEGLFVLILLG